MGIKRVIGIFILTLFGGSSVFFASPIEMTENYLIKDLAVVRDISPKEGGETALADRLEKALSSYQSVRSYEAFFYKRELSGGTLGEEEKIYLRFDKPWKIFMGWLNTSKAGLQVVYERGRHDGKLAIHKPGLIFGLVPVIFLEQDSPWVREGSESYDIEDAGIGTFLFDFTRAVTRGAREKKLNVSWEEGAADVRFPGSEKDDDFFAYRVLVSFDENTQLPVRMELFDWQNQLTGIYRYEQLKIDTPSDSPEFKKQINYHLFKIYNGTRSNTAKPKTKNFAKVST
jgi:hypothetical protein